MINEKLIEQIFSEFKKAYPDQLSDSYLKKTIKNAVETMPQIKINTELLQACEAADLSLKECTRYLLGSGPIPEPEAIVITVSQIKKAIGNAEGEK